jgi:hypothetical protein
MELGNQVHCVATTAVLLHFVLRTQRSPLAVQFMPDGLLRARTICVVSLRSLSSACTLLPKNGRITCSLFTYLFSFMKLVNPEIFIWVTTLRTTTVFIKCNVVTAWQSQRPHSLSIKEYGNEPAYGHSVYYKWLTVSVI